MSWATVREFFRPSKTRIIILLSFVACYLFVTLLQTFFLYSIVSEMELRLGLSVVALLGYCGNDTGEPICDDDFLRAKHDEALAIMRQDIIQTKQNLGTLDLLKIGIFPGASHMEVIGDKGWYTIEDFTVLFDIVITPTLVLSVLVMLGYWYIVACMLTAIINRFRRVSGIL